MTSRGAQSFVITNARALDIQANQAPRVTVIVLVDGEPMELSAEALALGRPPELDLVLVRVRGIRLTPRALTLSSKVRFFLQVNGLQRLLTQAALAPSSERH
jgi:hypothetical protein